MISLQPCSHAAVSGAAATHNAAWDCRCIFTVAWEHAKVYAHAVAALLLGPVQHTLKPLLAMREGAVGWQDWCDLSRMPAHDRAPGAGMAAQSPLAAVLAGLELLLARSQLWQDSAAAHVSIAAQLERLSALALRWRRMQLHAWRATIHKLKQRHAAGRSIPCAEHLHLT